MRVAKEWDHNEVTRCGKNRSQRVTSLQKEEGAGHKSALKVLEEAEKETLPLVVVKTLAREKEINSKHFRWAYKEAKENKSFCNSEELSRVDKWRILHYANACAYMGNHINIEMRKTLAKEIISSIIIDESTTLS